jgi:cellulose synthase/poly-beta-1,6-N-acetylglucosamine synthase-like glycosyltransferase
MIDFLFFSALILVLFLDIYHFLLYLLSKNEIGEEGSCVPFLSVVIPVYNNASTIMECIDSVKGSNYRDFEIIVVDDGSQDATPDILKGMDGVLVINQPHEGKYAALNAGVRKARGDIVTIDADTVIEKDTLMYLGRRLSSFHAVAGNLRVRNDGLLVACQAIEHIRAAMFKRIASGRGELDIIPGPIGAFRSEVFQKLKFEQNLVEDLDMTIRVKDEGFKVGYEPHAIAYTRMPSGLEAFFSQRERWAEGNLILALKRRIPAQKIVSSLVVASLDLIILFLSLSTSHYNALLLFFSVESLTMIVGNQFEDGGELWASLLFPISMWILDATIIFTYTYAFIRIASSGLPLRD